MQGFDQPKTKFFGLDIALFEASEGCASICGQVDPGAVIRPVAGEWQPRIPEQLDEEELADWRAGRNAVYQLTALTIGARFAVAEA